MHPGISSWARACAREFFRLSGNVPTSCIQELVLGLGLVLENSRSRVVTILGLGIYSRARARVFRVKDRDCLGIQGLEYSRAGVF